MCSTETVILVDVLGYTASLASWVERETIYLWLWSFCGGGCRFAPGLWHYSTRSFSSSQATGKVFSTKHALQSKFIYFASFHMVDIGRICLAIQTQNQAEITICNIEMFLCIGFFWTKVNYCCGVKVVILYMCYLATESHPCVDYCELWYQMVLFVWASAFCI